jgi:hypothetical protein
MTAAESGNPAQALSDAPQRRRWTFKLPRRRDLIVWVLILGYFGYTGVRDWSRRRGEREFNARVAPLLKANPRFAWVFVGGEAGYIRGYISPSGVVQSQADLAALQALLQGAQPPMPLDLQFVKIFPGMAPILPPTTQSTTAPTNGGPPAG